MALLRIVRVLVIAGGALAVGAAAAAARGHGGGHGGHGSHGHHGGGHGHFHSAIIGAAPFYPPGLLYPYYAPYAFYDPYAVVYPPDVIIVTTPLYTAPVLGECRPFQGNAVMAGTIQPFFGTACFQSDGAWHAVE